MVPACFQFSARFKRLAVIVCVFMGTQCAQFHSEGSALGYLLLGDGAGGGAAGILDWDATDWSHRRILTINAGTIGTDLAAAPVLIQLDSSRIDYTVTQPGGADLRFYDASGVLLSHEIETWNSGGTSIVWVKVPSITAGSTTGQIRMYYGNASAADGQSTTDVWSESYSLVLHLNETTGGGGTRADASGNSTAGTFVDADGDSDTAAAGRIGTGDGFNGDADEINMGNQAGFALTTFTITGWFQTSCVPFCTLVTRNIAITNRNYYLGLWDGAFVPHTTGEIVFRTSSGPVDVDIGSGAGTTYNDGAWHYFAAVLDGTTLASLYLDGGAALTQVPAGVPDLPAANLRIGHDTFSTGMRYFSGTMDEIRISSVARSADWIALQYLSQSDSLLTFGAEEIN